MCRGWTESSPTSLAETNWLCSVLEYNHELMQIPSRGRRVSTGSASLVNPNLDSRDSFEAKVKAGC